MEFGEGGEETVSGEGKSGEEEQKHHHHRRSLGLIGVQIIRRGDVPFERERGNVEGNKAGLSWDKPSAFCVLCFLSIFDKERFDEGFLKRASSRV